MWKDAQVYAQNASGSPSDTGKKFIKDFGTKSKELRDLAIFFWRPTEKEKTPDRAILEFKELLTGKDYNKTRIEINPYNFDKILGNLAAFFTEDSTANSGNKFEIVHGFFSCIPYWNETHKPVPCEDAHLSDTVNFGGGSFKGLDSQKRNEFCKQLSRYEIKNTNRAAYFARYDAALDAVDKDYRKNFGIFFTSEYLASVYPGMEG